jgi:hypothetical protein
MNQFLISSLTDFLLVENFNQLRSAMQAELVPPIADLKIKKLDIDEILATVGMDVTIDDIIFNKNGTIDYHNKKVILHIRDIASYGDRVSLPKYHLANCSKLQEMWQKNHSNRYVVATRSDGIFTIKRANSSGKEWNAEEAELDVCKLCLNTLNWKGYASKSYHEKNHIFENFNLEEFFEKYPNSATTYRPQYTDKDAPTNTYSQDFPTISIQYRAAKNWRCETCNIDLSAESRRRFLHVHHRNGQKNENQHSNLQALCIECHSQQPQHEHMHNHPDLSTFMKEKAILNSELKAS